MINNSLSEIYQVPAQFRWTLANADLIGYAVFDNQSFKLGRRSKLIFWIIKIASILGMSRLVVAMAACFDCMKMWSHRASDPSRPMSQQSRIFVGFGAGPEEEMWTAFSNERGGEAVRLDETRPETFLAYHRPALFRLWREIWQESGEVTPFLQEAELKHLSAWRLESLSFAASRLGKYCFYREWWRGLNSQDISQVVFIAADTPAFACVDAKVMPVEYRQHGLLKRSIIMPDFATLKFITKVESENYKNWLPHSKREVVSSKQQIKQHEKVLLITSVYDMDGFKKAWDMDRVKSLIAWAEKAGLQVLVRKHPRETDRFWTDCFPNVAIDLQRERFDDALLRLRPQFVVSWFSTSLVDALSSNVIPVSVMQPSAQHVKDMIFEFPKHCCMWPEHQSVMQDLVNGKCQIETAIAILEDGAGFVND